jgi:hypothetical protein
LPLGLFCFMIWRTPDRAGAGNRVISKFQPTDCAGLSSSKPIYFVWGCGA